jgi:hypothetical protein
MFHLSKDTPAYYLTSVTNKRLPVFKTSVIKDIVTKALAETRNSAEPLVMDLKQIAWKSRKA